MINSQIKVVTRSIISGASKIIGRQSHQSVLNFNVRQLRSERYISFSSNGRRRRSLWESIKALTKESPILVPTAFILMFISSGILLWTNKYYSDYILGAFHTFPEPVAKQLRKALFFTNVEFKPSMALKYYKEAIRVAEELGVDRFSNEMMGIKVQIALLFEKCQNYHKAIEILEAIRNDNIKWLEVVGLREGWQSKRNIVLQKTVQISVKLGDLYSNQHVLEPELAEERVTWAVQETLREQKRRKEDGVKEDEGPWFDKEEIGSQFETLAHMHEEKNRHYLSAPLFLHALNLSPPESCHTVVLINNFSTSLAQQLPASNQTIEPITRENLITNAIVWAEKAIALAGKIQPPQRNDECDIGCAVAMHNLGEFSEMRGDIVNAKKKYQEAMQLAKNIGFKTGINKANAALRRIENSAEEKNLLATDDV